MRRRLLARARNIVSVDGCGRFLGNEFYMTSGPMSNAEGNNETDTEPTRMSTNKRGKLPRPLSACDWVLSYGSLLKGKRIPHSARGYLQHFIHKESCSISLSKMAKVYCSLDELGLLSEDLFHALVGKFSTVDMARTSSTQKEELADISIQLLHRASFTGYASQEQLRCCTTLLLDSIHSCQPGLHIRVASLYPFLCSKGLINLTSVEELIRILLSYMKDCSSTISLDDCGNIIIMLDLLKLYLVSNAKMSSQDPFINDVQSYVVDVIFPNMEKKMSTFTAAQITSVATFMSEAKMCSQDLIKGFCERFMRDISQFSISDMLKFNQALLQLGHHDDSIVIRTMTYLPRRAQSLTSVEHLIALGNIVNFADLESDYLKSYLGNHLLQLANKIGATHCEMLSEAYGKHLRSREALGSINRIRAKYMLTKM